MGDHLLARLPLAAAASAALFGAAEAGVIVGSVTFPSGFTPSMTVYAAELDTLGVSFTQLVRGQTNFSLDVPPGRYWVFVAPNEPGSPNVYGAFTRYSLCARDPSSACEDHSLMGVAVSAKSPRANVVIDDWYLSDDVADQIDQLRGQDAGVHFEPLGAPRFSEYPSESFVPSGTPAIDFSGADVRDEDRRLLEQALASGPNFAGYLSAAPIHCGSSCSRIVLLNWRTGQLLEPTGLNDIEGELPCRGGQAHLFRRDSRLLTVTRTLGALIVTQYYVWNQKNSALALTGEYRRTAAAFCAVAAR